VPVPVLRVPSREAVVTVREEGIVVDPEAKAVQKAGAEIVATEFK
jgi:hypothetical protein